MCKDGITLITGGAGYIGSHLNKVLSTRGYRTLVVDNLSTGHRELVGWGEFLEGDLRDRDFLDRVFRDYPISTVMHLAACAYVHESIQNPLKYYDNNVVGTLRLVQAMVAHNVPFLVFSSTCATYGVPQAIPISEQHPQQPINPYGQSKLMSERIIAEACRGHGIRTCILRYFNAAGADPEADIGERHSPEPHLIPSLLEVACGRREWFPVLGRDYPTPDGTCVRDFIHVMDIAQAHVNAMDHLRDGGGGGAFNLGNGGGYSVLEVMAAVERITGRKLASRNLDRRPGDPPVLVGDASKAWEVLKWRPRYRGLDPLIDTAWKWHHQEACCHGG